MQCQADSAPDYVHHFAVIRCDGITLNDGDIVCLSIRDLAMIFHQPHRLTRQPEIVLAIKPS